MKKLFIAIVLLIAANSLFAQEKKDTVTKTVYIYDHTDTVKVETLTYKGEGNNVKWCSPGWQIWKGRAYNEGKTRYWLENPVLIGGLDDKRKPVKAIN